MATIVETIGSGGTHATIAAWLAANQTPITSGNIYVGELIDQVYEVDAGTLAATIGSSQTGSANYRWLRSAASAGGYYRPERHTGPRVYVRWTGSADQSAFRVAENFFRMSGFALICEDPQEVTGGNKYGVKIESDSVLCSRMFVSIKEGGNRGNNDLVAPFFFCYYVNGTGTGAAAADAAVFLNCIAHGSRYFKGANYGFYYDNFASNGGMFNCAAYNVTRGAGSGRGYIALTGSTVKPKAVNCIAIGCSLGWQGTYAFLIDPAVDPVSPLNISEQYQCVTDDLSLPVDDFNPRASLNRNYVDGRSIWGRPDVQDFRLVVGSFPTRLGRDMSSQWTAFGITPEDFDGTARGSVPINAGGIGWTIGPYVALHAPFSTSSPTVEVKSIGSGAGRDYATVQAWLAATDNQSLVYQNKVLVGELYADSAFVIADGSRIAIRRSVSDAAHYRQLRPAAGHAYDLPSASGVVVSGTGGSATGENNLVEISEDYFRLSGPVLVDQTYSLTANRRGIKVDGNYVRVDSVYGRFLTSTGTASHVFFLRGSRLLVTNCIARGSNTGTSGPNTGFQIQNCEFTRVLNCDADRIKGSGGGIGFRESPGTDRAEIRDCIATDCTTCFSHATAANAPRVQQANIASDATADGPGSQDNVTSSSLFQNASAEDYRNKASSTAIKRGLNLSSRFSADFLGRPRYAPFDVGAYEGLPIAPEFEAPQFQSSHAYQTLFELYRRDGVAIFVTDQNEPVAYRGRVYSPTNAFISSNRRGEGEMRERSFSVRAAVGSFITSADLAAGRYRGARVREILLGRYAWTAPLEEHIYIWGDADFDGETWNVDFLSIASLLENNAGRQCTVGCPLTLGDDECGKDITPDTIDDVRVSATITDPRRSFRAEAADISASYADGFFTKGKLTWLTGAAVGTISQVKSYTSSTRAIVLEDALPADVVQNDTFQIEPGCQKRYLADCIGVHSNGENFGGDPLQPGTDKALSTPTR